MGVNRQFHAHYAKTFGEIRGAQVKMLRNETLCNWCIVLELRRKDTSSSHFEHMGCSKNSSLVIVGVSCYSLDRKARDT